ncbi:hypothetical protein [Siccirubricoccus sp. G192]|uniref:hypothetical protein n=1 Tax=Siccirubricoccus sp. G192 TaxID=2849651 RepID=UPI001C2BA20C|nr:hypothetical protein [Siccirubricoccus sp. G192]MBV1800211.1 hypothetical protein [Siccirubricoccus sp. G192]
MQAIVGATLAMALLAGTAAAQTPAAEASRRLEQGVDADRLRDAARDARGDPRPAPPEVRQFEPQRRTLQPDVGRPEEGAGSAADGTRGATGMGQNPQR